MQMSPEVKQMRQARSLTQRNNDGSLSEVNYGSDIHYDNWDRRGDGQTGWRKCDPIIEVNPGVRAEHVDYQDNGWRVLYMPYNAWMPQTADGVFQFRDCRSVPGERKDIRYTVQPLEALPVTGAVVGTEVVYAGAYGPGADLVYQLRASGVAKLVRIQPDSAATGPFRFRVSLPAGAKVMRTNGRDTYELDKRGPKLADSARKTIIEVRGRSTYLYPFRWRSGIDSGVLPVVMEPDGNDWIFTKSIPAEWSRELPVEIDLTASGTTVSDGYIGHTGGATFLADTQAATGNTSGFADTANAVWYKKGTATRGSISGVFAFSNTVPMAAVISAIANAITITATNATYTGSWVQWSPTDPTAPTTSDWAFPTKRGSTDWGANTIACNVATTVSVNLTATAIAAFTKMGTNGYAVRETTHDLGQTAFTGGTNGASCGYSENATPGNRPTHTITYTVPANFLAFM